MTGGYNNVFPRSTEIQFLNMRMKDFLNVDFIRERVSAHQGESRGSTR